MLEWIKQVFEIPWQIGITLLAFVYTLWFFGGKNWGKWWAVLVEILCVAWFVFFIWMVTR